MQLVAFGELPIGARFEAAIRPTERYVKTGKWFYRRYPGGGRNEQQRFPDLRVRVRFLAEITRGPVTGLSRRRNPSDDAPETLRSFPREDPRVHRVYDEPVTERAPATERDPIFDAPIHPQYAREQAQAARQVRPETVDMSSKAAFGPPAHAGTIGSGQGRPAGNIGRSFSGGGGGFQDAFGPSRGRSEEERRHRFSSVPDRNGNVYVVTSTESGKWFVHSGGLPPPQHRLQAVSEVEAMSLAKNLAKNMHLTDAKTRAKAANVAHNARVGMGEAKQAFGKGYASLKSAWEGMKERHNEDTGGYAQVPMLMPPAPPAKKTSKKAAPKKAAPKKAPKSKKAAPKSKSKSKKAAPKKKSPPKKIARRR